MKTNTKNTSLLSLALAVFLFLSISPGKVLSQTGVLDPNDPIVVYDVNHPPSQPAYGTIAKWVKTDRLNWNTSSFKSYIYKGLAFRLKFPKTYQHNVADGKTYPLFVFFHGRGETGTIYDNEFQMYHGGEVHGNAVDNGQFDGFLLYPQNPNLGWGPNQYDLVNEIITKYLIPQVKVDPWRISVDGLSAGGAATWQFLLRFPKLTAAALPISNTDLTYANSSDLFKFTPVWQFQGALDPAPTAGYTHQLVSALTNVGSNYRYTEYPDQGHGCWYSAWAEPDYFPFMLRAHKANPWALFGRTQFCANDVVNITVGVTPGFTSYRWRKDGVLINGASGNTINVTSFGTYDCSILDGGVWSPWSPAPLVVGLKAATISPNIQLANFQSIAYPAPDTSTGIWLQVPAGYASYEWRKDGLNSVLGTTRFLKVTSPGNYKIKVTEQFGCSSDFSPLFTIVDANGQNGPDAPLSLTATVLSKTAIKLTWSQNAAPAFNENAFEIYQSNTVNGAYVLAGLTGADASTFTLNNLNAGTPYYYKLRAINANAASAVTNPVVGVTLRDTIAPSTPGNLRVNSFSRNQVDLSWDAATDDVGVVAYNIYINGVKSYVTTNTNYSVYNLTAGKPYNFTVRARDFANNISLPSNQASATTFLKGLTYKFYQGLWNVLPDFNSITPVSTGTISNVNINNSPEGENFGYLFEGYIKIPVSGSYTFRLNSDDGSKLYIGAPYNFSAAALINNDGLHGPQDVDGTITLTAGIYPVAVAFFQLGGGANCDLSWSTPQTGGNFSPVPDSVFTDGFVPLGTSPSAPSNLTATAISARRINLSWTDNSSNETGFEIYRSTVSSGPFSKIITTAANKNSYADSTLTPAAVYYYKVKAIGKYGESIFNDGATSALSYAYYEGSYSSLPDFSTLTPKRTGIINNFGISASYGLDNFLYKFDGIINIPAGDTYTFYTASDDGSQLFIDGNLVVNNDGLHGTQEQSGSIALTAGIHSIRVTFFELGGGESLYVQYSSSTIPKQAIPDNALVTTPVNDTTFALPGVPDIPSIVSVVPLSPSVNSITWKNNNSNETSFELYRSTPGNANYQLLKTIPANILSYSDTSLNGNTIYYYKIRSINESGASGFSNEINATTFNNVPVINSIGSKSVHFGTQLQVNIISSDIDNETLSYSFTSLPSFSTYTPTGNGTGILTFSPQAGDQNIYTGITVTVTDQHGGIANTSFNLTVNDNYIPVISGNNSVTINEGSTGTLTVNATDQNAGNILNWTLQNVPGFATPVINGNSVGFNFSPGFADNGVYTITLVVSDGKGGTDTKSFTVTVNDQTPPNNKIYINFNNGNNATGVWNNTNALPAINKVFFPFKDDQGNITTAGIKILTNWQSISPPTGTTGVNTGNNSGIYPDAVTSSFYWTSIKQTFKVTGLDTASKYNFTFFGSRAGVNDVRVSQYTVNGTSVTLNAVNNSQNTARINALKPGTDSSLSVDIQPAAGSAAFSYINALVIEKIFDDHTAPATPKDFSVTYLNGAPRLNWRDVSYNETSYEVYRSTGIAGPYQLVSPVAAANTTIYSDTTSSLAANTVYYYKVRAINTYGASGYSTVQALTLPNRAPVLAFINNQSVKVDSIKLVNISASDDPGNMISLTANGLPAFATLTDNGNGTGTLRFAPNSTQKGLYNNITITATDNFGASNSRQFSIIVSDGGISTVYINFNDGSASEPAQGFPWNNFNAVPTAGKTVSNLTDDSGVNTGTSLSLAEAWTGANAVGVVTGNNSGIYPDNVSLSLFYENSANVKHVNLTGLSASKKYNLTFYASRADVTDNRTTQYTVGAQSVSLNASGNSTNTVSLNALTPDANGQIAISIVRTVGSFAYLNALVVQSYVDNGNPLSPSGLTAAGISKDKISLNWVDKSINETGFEIWRSTGTTGTYTLLNSVGANVTSYTDGGLTSGSIYFYKVRAKANSLYSGYSNFAGGSSATYSVSINFNDGTTAAPPAPAPWNNTNSVPYIGFALNNLLNDVNQYSGLNLVSQSTFGGSNNLGLNTGNNSGIFPDNVLRSNWFLDAGDTGRIKITGLNQAMVYSFSFIASRQGTGTRNTVYKIGNQTSVVNAMGNIASLAQIKNVVPDSTGSISIKIFAQAGSIFGYITGLQMLAAPSTDTTLLYNLRKNKNKDTILLNAIPAGLTDDLLKGKLLSYPNPFVSDITLRLLLKQHVEKLMVRLIDLSGRLVYTKQFNNLEKGVWQQQVGLNGNQLKNGIYLLEITGIPGEKTRLIRLLK